MDNCIQICSSFPVTVIKRKKKISNICIFEGRKENDFMNMFVNQEYSFLLHASKKFY